MFKTGIIALIIFPTLFFLFGCSNKSGKNTEKRLNSSGNTGKSLGGFYFVGIDNGIPAVFNYNSNNKRVSVFWSNEKEKVIDFSYSKNYKHAFFLTAGDYGKLGALPFLRNVKLYLINTDSAKARLIKKIGNGIQIFTAWESENNFKLILNSFDKTVANFINQETLIYSEFGRKLVDNQKTYDITKEPYPKPPSNVRKFDSPDGEKLSAKIDSSGVWIYLYHKSSDKIKLITKTDQSLNDAEWSSDGRYLVFSTLDISPKNNTLKTSQPSTSKLYVYSLTKKRIIKAWNGNGIKNFYIKNNFLIFDDGFGNNSSIHIFNLRTNELINTIRIKGGCGLRNIPSIPKYSS